MTKRTNKNLYVFQIYKRKKYGNKLIGWLVIVRGGSTCKSLNVREIKLTIYSVLSEFKMKYSIKTAKSVKSI